MRNLLLFLALALPSSVIAQNCRGTMDPRTFSMNLQQIRVMPTEELRYQRAMNTVQSVCLSAAQVYELGILLSNDDLKYDLAAAAYLNLTDQQNAYLLLDMFSAFSGAFRFHDYMNFVDRQRGKPGISPRIPGMMPKPEPQPDPVVNPVPRPTPPPCAVTDNDMREVRQAIQSEFTSRGAVEQGKMVIRAKQCFSTDQIVSLIPLFSTTSSQLEMAKYAYDYCIDRNNYFKVVNAMSISSAKEDLRNYIQARQ